MKLISFLIVCAIATPVPEVQGQVDQSNDKSAESKSTDDKNKTPSTGDKTAVPNVTEDTGKDPSEGTTAADLFNGDSINGTDATTIQGTADSSASTTDKKLTESPTDPTTKTTNQQTAPIAGEIPSGFHQMNDVSSNITSDPTTAEQPQGSTGNEDQGAQGSVENSGEGQEATAQQPTTNVPPTGQTLPAQSSPAPVQGEILQQQIPGTQQSISGTPQADTAIQGAIPQQQPNDSVAQTPQTPQSQASVSNSTGSETAVPAQPGAPGQSSSSQVPAQDISGKVVNDGAAQSAATVVMPNGEVRAAKIDQKNMTLGDILTPGKAAPAAGQQIPKTAQTPVAQPQGQNAVAQPQIQGQTPSQGQTSQPQQSGAIPPQVPPTGQAQS